MVVVKFVLLVFFFLGKKMRTSIRKYTESWYRVVFIVPSNARLTFCVNSNGVEEEIIKN